jgi:hypothetical protein
VCKLATPKGFSVCSPRYIFLTVKLFLPFLWKRGVTIIYFLTLVNSWAQVKSQCSSAKAALKPVFHSSPWKFHSVTELFLFYFDFNGTNIFNTFYEDISDDKLAQCEWLSIPIPVLFVVFSMERV